MILTQCLVPGVHIPLLIMSMFRLSCMCAAHQPPENAQEQGRDRLQLPASFAVAFGSARVP